MSDLDLRFLSISQPWLWAITDLPEPQAKRIENRSWAPPPSMLGKRIALHAAKSWDASAHGFIAGRGFFNYPRNRSDYPAGVITAVATIVRVVDYSGEPDRDPRTLPDGQGQWLFGPYGWLLSDVRKLELPIGLRGAQGLRRLDPELARRVLAQVAA